MANFKQPWLPKLRVERVVSEKYPQPKIKVKRPPKKFELLYHPFDLRFKGRLNRWLRSLQEVKAIRLEKILDKESLRIIKLYFFPQGPKDRWLNQDEVLIKTKKASKQKGRAGSQAQLVSSTSKKKLRKRLVESLIRIWSEVKT